MQMKAAVSRGSGQDFSIENVALEDPRDDEILVEIKGVGLCHTDLLARDGFIPIAYPSVLGHEGAGVVRKVGAGVKSIRAGDHVVLTFASCGHCRRCDRAERPYCESGPPLNYGGSRPDGTTSMTVGQERVSSHFFGQSSFASMALAYESNAIVVDKALPLELLGPLGCGVQTGAGAVMNTLGCEAGSSLLITGGGSLGLTAVLAARLQGCATIIVSEPHAARRALALELGATHAIDPAEGNVAAAVRAIAAAGVDYAFDTTGLSAVVGDALASLGVRGVLAIAGVPPKPDSVLPVPILPLIGMGQTVKGVVEGDSEPKTFIPKLIELYRAGRFPFDKLVKIYPLDRINDAVADHHAARCVKAVLVP
jgi:aryl-alcohol dehydrogenase